MATNTLLSTIVLVAFIVTVVLAIGSYLAYKARERRRPRSQHLQAGSEPIFFERFFPQRTDAAPVTPQRETPPRA